MLAKLNVEIWKGKMLTLRKFLIANCILLALAGCSSWWHEEKQQPNTPSTLDNSVYSQDAMNNLLHSASKALGSKPLAAGVDSDNNYTTVYGLTLQSKPIAVAVMSTPANNTYFTKLLKSPDISKTIFSNKSGIKHSPTTIVRVSYDEINNQAAKVYLNSLGFNSSHNFLKRTTYLYKNEETMTLIDYILPNQKTNSFDL
jgi:hypothetical protein